MARFAWVLSLLAVVLLFAGCAGDVSYSKGERFEVLGDWDRAVAYYRQALQEDPEDIKYRTRLTKAQEMATNMHMERAADLLDVKNADGAIHEAQEALVFTPDNDRAAQILKKALVLKQIQLFIASGQGYLSAGRPNEALNEFYKVLELDPDNQEAKDYIAKITKQKVVSEGEDEELTLASEEPITLSFKDAKLKEVFEFLSKLSGISILFDEDVKDQPVTVFAKDVSFTQALKLLLATNKLFMKKIAPDAIIIIPKTKSKLDQYQDLQVKTFYLSNVLAKDMVNIIRTMLETRKVIINEQLNSITLRETPDKLKLAEKLIEANDRKDSEAIIDVAVMSVDRNESARWGLNLPKSVTAQYVPPGAVVPAGQAVTDLTTNVTTSLWDFTAGLSNKGTARATKNIFITYPSVTADWLKTSGDAETLTNPQIRVLNKKPAKILVGSRVPVQTGTAVAAGGVTTSTFEYRDVGIKLTVEPYIGVGNDVSIKTTLEVSSLGDNVTVGTSTQPTFNTTTAETVLNLSDGETVIIGGLLDNVKANSMNGIVGISDIPLLGKIFSTNNIGPNRKRELIMTLTPHIVRAQEVPASDVSAFWSGTEEAYDTKPLFEEKKQKLSVPETEEEAQAKKAAAAPKPAQPAGPAAATEAAPEPGTPARPAPKKIGRVGTVSFAPEVAPVEVGQEITVDVTATDLDSVFEAPLSIIYNPKLVDFVKATEGGYMKVDGKPTSFSATANDKVGYIDVFLTRLGKVPGIAGSGTLFSLTFKGKSPGISPLVFKQNTLKDTDGRTVSADLKTGTLYVK